MPDVLVAVWQSNDACVWDRACAQRVSVCDSVDVVSVTDLLSDSQDLADSFSGRISMPFDLERARILFWISKEAPGYFLIGSCESGSARPRCPIGKTLLFCGTMSSVCALAVGAGFVLRVFMCAVSTMPTGFSEPSSVRLLLL